MQRRLRGFTVVELLVVLAITALLLSVAVPRYLVHIRHAEEVALKQNLFQVRDALDKFQSDKGRHAASLEELVSARYLRQLPVDPVTRSSTSWVLVPPEGGAQDGNAVYDLHSGAPGNSLGGEPYASW